MFCKSICVLALFFLLLPEYSVGHKLLSYNSYGSEFYYGSDKIYLIVKNQVSWLQAYYTCKEHKMNLASIETAEEQKLVTSFTVIVQQDLWIGAYNYEKDRMWRWIATGKPVVYTNWNNGEPNDLNNIEHYSEYCVFVYGPQHASHVRGRWNDENCFKKHYFVCERRFE